MRWRCTLRQLYPVLSWKFATACFLGLFLLFSHVYLMFCHCVWLGEVMAPWENFSCVFFFISLLIVSKFGWSLFVLKCGDFFLPIGRLFHFLHVRGPAERLLSCPVCWGFLLFFLLLLLFELWPVCLKLQFGWQICSPQGGRPFWKPLVWGGGGGGLGNIAHFCSIP